MTHQKRQPRLVADRQSRAITVRATRTACAIIAIAVMLAVTGLAGGTQKADAFVTSADYCGGYIYGWNYWVAKWKANSFEAMAKRRPLRVRVGAEGRLLTTDQYLQLLIQRIGSACVRELRRRYHINDGRMKVTGK